MDASLWEQADVLFAEGVDIPRAQREAWLDRRCSGDASLRKLVEDLLAADDEPAGPLDSPPEQGLQFSEPVEPEEEVVGSGDRIGAYAVVREIGRGGMGTVFLAERDDGQYRQRVAVKVVRRGMDTDQVVRRFVRERQVLARLQHPNIAQLLDGGVTADGRPFFVVEHVAGQPILGYCEERRSGPSERLRLFQQVCDAVQYAHRNLVVHRDLKPSNILVTTEGQVKLLDFGIAKALDDAEETLLTRAGERVLTPEYAAPEQLRGERITTATDVYALGVVLGELLTGKRPGTGKAARIEDADLETIVQACLREEPERRYASAQALREDVARYLDGFPVQARPDSFLYRAGKFARRNRVAAAAIALSALSLTAGVGAALWQARLALGEARKAQVEKDFILDLFQVSDPNLSKGENLTAREILDRGAERLKTELAGQPEIQAEMLGVVGEVYRRLGMYDRADPLIARHLEVYRRTHAADLELAAALGRAADLRQDQGRFEESEALLREGLAIRRLRQGEGHADTARCAGDLSRLLVERGRYDEAERLLAGTLSTLAASVGEEHADYAQYLTTLVMLKTARGDLDGAEPLMRRVLEIRLKIYGERHTLTSEAMSNLATRLVQRGRLEEAEPLYRRCLAIDRSLLGEEHQEVATDLNNLAGLLLDRGVLEETEVLNRRALAIREKLLGKGNPALAVNYHNLAKVLRERGAYPQAIELLRNAMAMNEKLLGNDHPSQAITMATLALTLSESGQDAAAEPFFRRSLALFRSKGLVKHPKVPDALLGYGLLLLDAGRVAEAEPVLREALTLRTETTGLGDWRRSAVEAALGRCLAGLGRADEARPLLERGIQGLVAAGREGHPFARGARAAALTLARRTASS